MDDAASTPERIDPANGAEKVTQHVTLARLTPFADSFMDYAKNGFHPIPIKYGSKRPICVEWQKQIDQPPDILQLRKQATKYPEANIGLVMGRQITPKLQLACLDIDTDDLTIQTAILALLPSSGTRVAKRGKKGISVFVLVPTGIKIRRIEKVLDLLVLGTQTLVPPSIHPATGKPYQWMTTNTLLNTPLSKLPELTQANVVKIVNAAGGANQAENAPSTPIAWEIPAAFKPRPIDPQVVNHMAMGIVLKKDEPLDLNMLEEALDAIPPTIRSTYKNWLMCTIACANEAHWHPEHNAQIFQILDSAFASAPKYDAAELRTTFENIMRQAPIYTGSQLSVGSIYQLAREHGFVERVLSPLMAGVGAAAPAIIPLPKAFKVDLTVYSNPRQWLYGTTFLMGEVAWLASPGGKGKSSISLMQGLCVATGRPLLGEKVWRDPSPVLYINCEDSAHEITLRFKAACKRYKLTNADIQNFFMIGADSGVRITLTTGDEARASINELGFQQVDELLTLHHPALFIIDPFGAFAPAGGNNNGVMGAVARRLKELAIKHYCAISLIHHTRKGENNTAADAISGASALINFARTALTISPMTEEEGKLFGLLKTETSSLFRLVSAKANHVPKGTDESAWYKLTSENLNNGDSQYYPNGDNVQVVERWIPPQISGQPTPQQLSAFKFVLEFVDSTMNRAGTGVPFSLHTKGGPNSRSLLKHIVRPLAHHANLNVEMDGKGFAKQCVDILVNRGWLVALPPKKNGPQKGWSRAATVWNKTPWATKDEAAQKIAQPTEPKPDHVQAAARELGAHTSPQVGTADRIGEMAAYAKRIERGEV